MEFISRFKSIIRLLVLCPEEYGSQVSGPCLGTKPGRVEGFGVVAVRCLDWREGEAFSQPITCFRFGLALRRATSPRRGLLKPGLLPGLAEGA